MKMKTMAGGKQNHLTKTCSAFPYFLSGMYYRPGYDVKLATKTVGPKCNNLVTFKKAIKKTLEISLTMSEGSEIIVLSK